MRSASRTGWVGLTPRLTFGTRPDKALGDPAMWDRAEALIKDALERSGADYRIKEKDGAFYAPKIDIQVEDALGREWQTATIQVDLVMLPERFDLHYIDEEGKQQRPVAIHRAIYGSLERFIGVITEHFAGAFPLWLAPGPGRGHPDRRSPRRGSRGTGRRAARARPARRGRRTRTTGCRTRSAWPRSRRCRTWSSSATARSRPGPPLRGRVPASSNRPNHGTRFADRLAAESRDRTV